MSTPDLRRLRKTSVLRDSLSENLLKPADFILPYFIIGGKGKREKIPSMPEIFRFSVDTLLSDVAAAAQQDIRALLLFGLSETKSDDGKEAYSKNGNTQKAIRAIKKEFPEILVYTDVCLCAYTAHGHCGILKEKGKSLDHKASAETLGKIAVSHAESGADFVAPSAMMDGQVGAIREALDQNGFEDTGILAYAAKYASHFYGPFREALDSSPGFGDRKSYQMDYRNASEALREMEQDRLQGADILMVKPALAYLDILARAKEKFQMPLAAYNVSGEYNMIKTAAGKDAGVEKELALEVLYSMKRAGADLIISYFSKQMKRWLQ